MTDGTELSLIGQYCPKLEELESHPSIDKIENFLDFGRQYGHRLKKLILKNSNTLINLVFKDTKYFRDFFKSCSRLKELDNNTAGNGFVDRDPQFLPKLETLSCLYFYKIGIDQEDLGILADKYGKTLKRLWLTIGAIPSHEPTESLSLVSRFESLLLLNLRIFNDSDTEIDDWIIRIGQKCPKLKKFNLAISEKCLISEDFLKVFTHFKSLEELILSFVSKINGSVKCFKECSKLKRFCISCPELSEDFFDGIQTSLPNIRFIDFIVGKQVNNKYNQLFISLSSLKNLKEVLFIYRTLDTNEYIQTIYYYNKYWKYYDPDKYVMLNNNCAQLLL